MGIKSKSQLVMLQYIRRVKRKDCSIWVKPFCPLEAVGCLLVFGGSVEDKLCDCLWQTENEKLQSEDECEHSERKHRVRLLTKNCINSIRAVFFLFNSIALSIVALLRCLSKTFFIYCSFNTTVNVLKIGNVRYLCQRGTSAPTSMFFFLSFQELL